MIRHANSFFIIGFSLLCALLLSVMPLPDGVLIFWPAWTSLVLIYWALEAPESVGLGVAFIVGLLEDLLTGELLGAHASGEVIIIFMTLKFRHRVRFQPVWQQAFLLALILLNDRFVHLWVSIFNGLGIPDFAFWLPPFGAMVMWPFLYLILDRIRYRNI